MIQQKSEPSALVTEIVPRVRPDATASDAQSCEPSGKSPSTVDKSSAVQYLARAHFRLVIKDHETSIRESLLLMSPILSPGADGDGERTKVHLPRQLLKPACAPSSQAAAPSRASLTVRHFAASHRRGRRHPPAAVTQDPQRGARSLSVDGCTVSVATTTNRAKDPPVSDKQAFLSELALQEADDGNDPTSQTVGTALGWDFGRTSQTLEGLENTGLVKATMAARRNGDTHLDDWVHLTAEGKVLVQALEHDGKDRAAAVDHADRWSRIDMPVLLELARAAESDEGVARIDYIARRHGLRTRDVLRSFDTLKRTGFVDAQLDPDSGGEYSFIRLSEKGLHTTGLWPTPETALDRMIAALDTIAENSNDEDTRTKAQKFSAWLRASGTTVGLSVASTVLTGQIPGSQ